MALPRMQQQLSMKGRPPTKASCNTDRSGELPPANKAQHARVKLTQSSTRSMGGREISRTVRYMLTKQSNANRNRQRNTDTARLNNKGLELTDRSSHYVTFLKKSAHNFANKRNYMAHFIKALNLDLDCANERYGVGRAVCRARAGCR